MQWSSVVRSIAPESMENYRYQFTESENEVSLL